MALYVYAPILQVGTREFITQIGAKRLVKHDGLHFINKGTPVDLGGGDAVICWGGMVPAIPHVPILNASLTYRNMFDINYKGAVSSANKGHNVFIMAPFKSPYYEQDLALQRDCWWPKVAKSGSLVALAEFKNFGIQYYPFDLVEKSLIFNNKTILGQTVPSIVEYVDQLKLNFAEVYYGIRNGLPYILKVITAPRLDESNMSQMVTMIKTWAVEVGAL